MPEQLNQGAFYPEWMESATPEQRMAMTFDTGQMLVAAGPGSGKTRVITGRIRYLIEEKGISPQQILTITFTRSAAAEMKRRAAGQCPQAAFAVFGTFHSVFYHIMVSSGYYRGYSFLTPHEQKQILKAVMKLIPNENNIQTTDAEQILSAVSYAKNTGKLPKETEPVYRAYLKECRLRKKLDFDDILLCCEELLRKNSEIRQFWQKRFSYIQIDEFQDINAVQLRVIDLLARQNKNLLVVGDDDQSIYSFRGSSPRFMQQFQSICPDAERIDLTLNFRSRPGITEAAVKCIGHNQDRLEKRITSPQKDDSQAVFFGCYADATKEMQAISSELKDLVENHKEEGGSIAVLCRTNAAMERFAAVFAQRGIPFYIREKRKRLFGGEICRDYPAFLRFLYRGQNRADLFCFLNKLFCEIPRSIFEEEVVDLTRIKPKDASYEKTLKRMASCFELAADLDGYGSFMFFYETMGYHRYLRRSYSQERLRQENEEAAMSVLKLCGSGRAEELLDLFEAYEKSFDEMPAPGDELPDDKVILMTYHGSKGLEFDRVYLPGLVEGEVPKGRMLSREETEEERRMLYVAMTRAKKLLKISSFGEHQSQFWEEIVV